MSLKVYQVQGARHQTVIFATSPEEAVAQAVECNLVGDWEMPDAVEVPLPPGYYLAYDPLLAAEQPELPLPPAAPEPEKPHTITSSGVKVYDDWRDNIVVDPDAPPLVWKAGRGVFGTHTSVPGRPYLASENSEDALSWNLFRTLERTGHLDVVTRALGLEDEFQVLYWYRPWDSAEPLPEIKAALGRVEPWGRIGGRYQTETDIILKGQRYLVMVECKLGKPGAHVRTWERGGRSRIPPTYEKPLRALLVDMQDWETTMRRFYQLLRHLVLANELCRPGKWPREPHLLAVVNDLNLNRNGVPHAAEFEHFRRCLCLAPEQTHLLTWQELLARAEATFDPGVRPLLAHARRLRYLQPEEDQAG
ncbi:MAG: hypothetical protein SXV54_19375 [Chloroflexota bacterium]|nr:hypothetical protein [Chloroflexota bacterium]